MRKTAPVLIALLILSTAGTALAAQAPAGLEKFRFAGRPASSEAGHAIAGAFNGYTNYWHSVYWSWRQYGNLFLLSLPDVPKSVAQNKVDLAEELGIPGLDLAEGFLSDWLASGAPEELADPEPAALAAALGHNDVLAFLKPDGELGRSLAERLPAAPGPRASLGSHQFNARDYHEVRAYVLADGGRRLFVVAAGCPDCRSRFRNLLLSVRDLLGRYEIHRGWFGAGTLLHSVTCHPGHPLEVIGRGMSLGNDWFTFSGYMDFMLPRELERWLGSVGLDVVTDVGTGKATHNLGSVAYGCRDWAGLKIQDMPTEEEWLKFVKDRGGHVFRPVFEPACDRFAYDGYIAIEGNKKQIDEENVPFILETGYIKDAAPSGMVLFTEKGRPFTREAMWEAILSRRAVGVLPQGKMLGPAGFRNALQMLLLDRTWLEDFFGDAVRLEAAVEGRELRVDLRNDGNDSVRGRLEIRTPPGLEIGSFADEVTLPAAASKGLKIPLVTKLEAMNRANPILVRFVAGGVAKRTLAVLETPPVVSLHRLIHGQAPEVVFPVSVHNYTSAASFPVEVRVFHPGRSVPAFVTREQVSIPEGGHREHEFRLRLGPGAYRVEASALGAKAASRLGVEAAAGAPRAEAVDVDGDGVMEYRLENAKVRITLLATGARVIEYIVKERGDNVLFKLWPAKEDTDKRPFRERGFYPYGGFEDFLGQASIETHKVYDAELVRASGPYVQVRMEADYYGNRLAKTFTLYGDSPLLEVRFALEFRNPETNMLGPQPILELGKAHGPEDLFVVPARSGRREIRMRPEEYFGEIFQLAEGWNAGYDTKEDVSFVGAFPVSEPEFLHMWMNHPSNGESHHYYAEFQPWVPIFRNNVRYFSYYLWGDAGSWEKGLEELRKRNLISVLDPDAPAGSGQ